MCAHRYHVAIATAAETGPCIECVNGDHNNIHQARHINGHPPSKAELIVKDTTQLVRAVTNDKRRYQANKGKMACKDVFTC